MVMFNPPHPGETLLEDVLPELGISIAELARRLGIGRSTVREALRPSGSYTTSLFESGIRRIAQKVGEEGVETALAGVVQRDDELLGESADLLFHLIVLLRARGLSLADAVAVLAARHAG